MLAELTTVAVRDNADEPVPDGSTFAPPQTVMVAILGAGFAGLGMAIRLQKAGLRDFVVLERADDVGGTWRDNVYPGAACDVPSHLYSFSFDLNPEWDHVYGRQAEIQAYLQACTDRHGLRDRIALNADVVSVRWDEDTARWHLHTADGRHVVARFVVHAVGALKDPRYPDIEGMDSFTGTAMHSARWDRDACLHGKRIGVVGTGASAIQVVPKLAEVAEHLTVFQRTPAWVRPRADRPYRALEKSLFRRLPAAMRLHRWRIYATMEARFPLVFGHDTGVGRVVEWLAKRDIRGHIPDPDLAARLTPEYRLGCKRILISSDWYPALARPNVDVCATAIERMQPDGVRLDDGRDIALDALVYCTGFTVERPLGEMDVVGCEGRNLTEYWGDRPRAYLGMTVPGFPNAFVLLGPNTGLGHNSVIVMIEAQVNYVLQAIQHVLVRPEVSSIDVQDAAVDRFVEELDADHDGKIWSSGCNSWYLGVDGINSTLWPKSTVSYIARTRRFDPDLYRVRPQTAVTSPP